MIQLSVTPDEYKKIWWFEILELCGPVFTLKDVIDKVQDNIKKLKSFGYHVYETAEGELACGDIGKGKLLPWEEIVKIIKEFE